MTDYFEGDLRLTVDAKWPVERFDGPNHGLAHCMKAVDFVVEIPSHILFIEFKDPDHPKARDVSKKEFLSEFYSGSLDIDLSRKFRDSWIYRRASNKVGTKPIKYIVLIACESLSAADLMARTDVLRRKLPISGVHGQDWTWFIEDCIVLNIKAWSALLPAFGLSRLSSEA